MAASRHAAWIAGSSPAMTKKEYHSRDAFLFAPEFCLRLPPAPIRTGGSCARPSKNRGEAERRQAHPTIVRATQPDVATRMCAGAEATPAGAARLSALHRGSRLATECFYSAQAALHAIQRARALPAPSIALKPSTWLAGRHAGGDDARTARERSVSLRSQEPLPLRLKEHPRERRPSMSEIRGMLLKWGRMSRVLSRYQ